MFDGIALNMPILRSSGNFADVSICSGESVGFFFVSDVGFVVVSEVQVGFTVRVAAVDVPDSLPHFGRFGTHVQV